MAKQMLLIHWKAVKWLLLPFVVASFGVPLLAVQGLGGSAIGQAYGTTEVVRLGQTFLPIFPMLAFGVGGVLALSAWHWDHRGDHVYALSLPVARWEYSLLKMGAGMALLLLPATAFLLGSLVATASVELPYGLRAYPLAVTTRFLLASTVAYGILFAMAAGTIRTTVIVLTTLVGGMIVGEVAMGFLGESGLVPGLENISFMETVLIEVSEWPGPFQVFFGDWTMIDV